MAGLNQRFGQIGDTTTDKVGFYGATPVAQQTNVAAVATTASTTTTPFGYSEAQANGLVTAVNAVITRLNSLGLFASS